jgi:hypothetical protein
LCDNFKWPIYYFHVQGLTCIPETKQQYI